MINPFPGASADVLVDLGERVLRVQVKSAPSAKPYCNGTGKAYLRYQFRLVDGSQGNSMQRYGDKGIDLFALVALDKKQVYYVATKELLTKCRHTLAITEKSFLTAAADSLDRCLAAL